MTSIATPGTKPSELMSQATRWVSADGREHVIVRMDREHAANAAGWLRENAVSLLMKEALVTGVDATRIAEVLSNPAGEMAKTPLHEALIKRATQR